MTRVPVHDAIWIEAWALAESGETFDAWDVHQAVAEEHGQEPNLRTIGDTLRTMSDAGVLTKKRSYQGMAWRTVYHSSE